MKKAKYVNFLEEAYDDLVALTNKSDSIEDVSVDDLAEIVSLAHLVKSAAADLLEMCQQQLISANPSGMAAISVPGATVEIKSGQPRKAWQHSALANTVANRIYESAIDLDTGEVTMSPQEMVQELLRYASVAYWRVTELNNLNIDADNYCEVGESKKSVIVRRTK